MMFLSGIFWLIEMRFSGHNRSQVGEKRGKLIVFPNKQEIL